MDSKPGQGWGRGPLTGGCDPGLRSSLERSGATGHGNLSRRDGSGSDSASPAWPGEGLVNTAFFRGLFRFLRGLGHYLLRQLDEFAPPVPAVE